MYSAPAPITASSAPAHSKFPLILGSVAVIAVLAVGGGLVWASQQVKTNEAKVVDTVVPIATTTLESVPVNSITQNQDQSEATSTTKKIGIQGDIKAIEAEISSCKSKYGDLSFCLQSNPMLGVINNCLKYVGDVSKAKECVLTQYMTGSGLPSVSMDGDTTKINGVVQVSSGVVLNETIAGYTVACIDKNTPKINGITDTSKARTLYTTTLSVDELCRESINYGVMCNLIDILPYTKCSEALKKYGHYEVSKEVDTIVQRYMKMLGLIQ